MRFLFVVNRVSEVKPVQSTAGLIDAAARRGHQVFVCGVADLAQSTSDRIVAQARAYVVLPHLEQALEILREAERITLDVGEMSRVVIRTNPGRDDRDWAHETALLLLDTARQQGAVVWNDPRGLMRASSKLYLSVVPPALRPRTLVSADCEQLVAFCRNSEQPVVLKPLKGSRGKDVFLMQPGDQANLQQTVEVLVRDGFAMAQAYVPEAEEGDTRLLLLDGEPLTVDGKVAAVLRVPPDSKDFRSNVHIGGTPTPGALDAGARATVEAIGPRLREDGILLAGLDVIGGKVVEVNVFSAGGLEDAGAFAGVDYIQPVLDALEGARKRTLPWRGVIISTDES